MEMQAPKGCNDMLAGESFGWRDSHRWQRLEAEFQQVCHQYGYQELRTPLLEYVDLFVHGVGNTTDVVTKEMFNIVPRGDDPDPRRMALRPEFTAGLVRAYLENGLFNQPQPLKMYAYGPAFRYENVQKGRFRQFHQLDVEVFGASDPAVDAEVIYMGLDLVGRLGLRDLVVHINSIGCPVCRPRYREALRAHFGPHLAQLCPDCNMRFEKNPLRLLDCKKDAHHPAAQSAPAGIDYLCRECQHHWDGLRASLDDLGVAYAVDTRIVRGLDYYTKTVFEVHHPALGAQSTLWGGGRYDGLVETVGGKPTPGVGFGMGMERVLMVLDELGRHQAFAARPRLDLFLVALGDAAQAAASKLLYAGRKAGLAVDIDYLHRSLKAQMKYANKLAARRVAIIGDEELQRQAVLLKEMDAGTQEHVELAALIDHIIRLSGGQPR